MYYFVTTAALLSGRMRISATLVALDGVTRRIGTLLAFQNGHSDGTLLAFRNGHSDGTLSQSNDVTELARHRQARRCFVVLDRKV